MTYISWIMFMVGVIVGMAPVFYFTNKFMDDELKSIEKNHKFFVDYAKITDEQFKSLEEYTNKRLQIFQDCVLKLCDICDSLRKDYDQNIDKIIEYSNKIADYCRQTGKDVEAVYERVKALNRNVDSSDTVNDKRWELIQEHILSLKEDKTDEYEKVDEADGSREGGYAWNQETEQASVVQGKEDALEIFDELEETGNDYAAEA